MLEVIDGVITFNRGDTVLLDVELVDGSGNTYTLREGDELRLTVREFPNASSPVLLQVENVPNEPSFAINPELTQAIPVGKYSCDIQLSMVDGTVVTVFPQLRPDQMGKDNKNWQNWVVNAEVTIP